MQAGLLWRLRPHESQQVHLCSHAVFCVGQSLMAVYPVVWVCADLGLLTAATEHVWVYTSLDITCKLALVWGCIVVRFLQAFPALHVTIDGSRQFLDASYDVRLTLDLSFRVRGIDGNKSLLHHYLGEGTVMEQEFLGVCHGEDERRKFLDVVRNVDRQGLEVLSPKLTLTLVRHSKGQGGPVPVATECVVSSAQSGLRLVAITFSELLENSGAADVSREDGQLQLPAIPSAHTGLMHFPRDTCGAMPRTPRNVETQSRADSDDGPWSSSGDSIGSDASCLTLASQKPVRWHARNVGALLQNEEEPAFLADVMAEEHPIIGVSAGFLRLSQYSKEDLIGASISFLEQGIPDQMISKSAHKNLASFCKACRLCLPVRRVRSQKSPRSNRSCASSHRSSTGSARSLKSCKSQASLGSIHFTQPNRRRDSSVFVNSTVCSQVMLKNRPYLLGVTWTLAEGLFAKLDGQTLEQNREESSQKLRRIAAALRAQSMRGGPERAGLATPARSEAG